MKKKPKALSFVQRFCLFFYRHVIFSAAFWIAIVVFGVLSYTIFLQRQGFPNVEVPVSIVRVNYFAGDKLSVDNQVTEPLVQTIGIQPDVKKTTASSTENGAVIVVEYKEGINSQAGSDQIKQASEEVALPDNAQVSFEPIDATRFNNKYDVLVSVSSSVDTNSELVSQAEAVAADLAAALPDAQVEAVDLYASGKNPITGEDVLQQVRFDWYGSYDQNQQSFTTNPSVTIGIRTPDGTDVVSFDKQLTDVLDELRENPVYGDININVSADFAKSINQQISSLQENLVQGLIIVIIVCLIFIGFRAGIMAALGMVVTLTTTVGVIYLAGLTLNTITLFALILCLGLIVDDTVIMVEATDALRKKEKDLHDTIAAAAKRIALASFAGTLTTLLGFAPMLFISGILGSFIRILPITIMISLGVSLFVSLSFIPFISRWFMKDRPPRKSLFGFVRTAEAAIGNTAAKLITTANTRRKKILRTFVAIGISVLVIFAAGPLFGKLKFDIFPTNKDSNAILIQYSFAPGTDIEQATDLTKLANEKISESVGTYIERFTYLGNANERSATASIRLVSYDDRDPTSHEIIDKINTAIAPLQGVRVTVSQQDAGPPKDDLPFKVQIAADNTAQAEQAAAQLVNYLEGLSVTRPNGTTFNVTQVEFQGEQQVIQRNNGQRIVQVSAGFDADDTSATVQATQNDVENFIADPANRAGLSEDDYMFDFGSETENQESFKTVLYALPILLGAMFILLAIQFRSIFQPLLILFAVPFSFFGVAFGLNITNNPLSFFAMIGFFALIGISVNNTILLTDFANQGRRAGLSPRPAMANAIKERIRPLLTTSTTSVLALLPLALSDPFWESITFTLIFGLISSTLLVVIAFPYYYLALEAVRSRARVRFAKKR